MKTRKTIAGCLNTIGLLTKGSKLTAKTYENISAETSYLRRKLHFTPVQSCIVAALLTKPYDSHTTQWLADFFKVSVACIFDWQTDMSKLVLGRCLNLYQDYYAGDCIQFFGLSEEMINAVRNNTMVKPMDYDTINTDEAYQRISRLLAQRECRFMSFEYMVRELRILLDGCSHLDFCNKISGLGLGDADLVLLLIAIKNTVIESKCIVCGSDYSDVLPTGAYRGIITEFKRGESLLQRWQLLEPMTDECNAFMLTAKAIENILGLGYTTDMNAGEEYNDEDYWMSGLFGDDDRKSPIADLCKPSTVVVKPMFYNKEEEMDISRLTDLLGADKFAEVQKRMRSAGMRTGFCCLFHGVPGTGKTETAMQIARETGREIIQVNLASIRDKYVGETERNIKEVFDNYRKAVAAASDGKQPILLFNEADALINKRTENSSCSVDKMENALVNIILEEMEKLDGIMIATTNLTGSLDKAFERRFLYKIEFRKPSANVRARIWKSMMPELEEKSAEKLAESFDFSGGQIENIARKALVDRILHGDKPLRVEEVSALCNGEKLQRKQVGFQTI